MKNNLTKIFSKIISKILAIIFVIVTLIIPSQVIATPSEEQGSSKERITVDIGSGKNDKIININNSDIDKYLFVGNSKTYYNNLPFMFQNYMKATGRSVIVREVARAGNSLKDLLENETVRDEFNNEFDYVVLQPKLLNKNGEEKAAAIEIVRRLKYKNPKIKVIINGIWKSGNEFKTSTKAQKVMNDRFRELKDEITKELGVETKISYWGQAVLRAHYTYSKPKGALFEDDRHPTVSNTYLGVACLYSTITGFVPSIEYNGTVVNSQFSSIKEPDNNNWYYQIDKDRWNKKTEGLTNKDEITNLQNIAYETYLAQNSSTPDQVEKVFRIDNSPRISIKNRDKNKGVKITITDYSGLNKDDITLYKSDKTTKINSKYISSIEEETREGVTCKLIYSIKNDFFNKKDKKIYIVAKDKNGNYNKSTFNIKWHKKNKYKVDAAPRIKSFELNSNRKKISFKVVDKAGIEYLKIFDVNQKDEKGKSLLVKKVGKSTDTKNGKVITIDLEDLVEKVEENSNNNDESKYYTIKVVSKDVNGRKCKRIVNFRVYYKK